MWKAPPAKSSHVRDSRRSTNGGDTWRGRDTNSDRSLTSTVATPPPRLAPLTTTVSSASTSRFDASPLTEVNGHSSGSSGFFLSDNRGNQLPNQRNMPRLSELLNTATEATPLIHSTPGHTTSRLLSPGSAQNPTDSNPSRHYSHSRRSDSSNHPHHHSSNGAPAFSALQNINTVHSHSTLTPLPTPPPPHLVALSVRRRWPAEVPPWRRSKPLTRRLTTTLNATALQGGRRQQPSHCLSDCRAVTPSPPRRTPTTACSGELVKREAGEEVTVCGATQSRTDFSTRVRGDAMSSDKRPSASVPPLSAERELDLKMTVDGVASPPRQENLYENAGVIEVGEDESTAVAVDVTIHHTDSSPAFAPHAADPSSASVAESIAQTETQPEPFVVLYKTDGQQSGYAEEHHLPQLFAEMVHDLALAQPQQAVASDNPNSNNPTELRVVEQWIQHWFRHRYHKAMQVSPEPSPVVRRPQLGAARQTTGGERKGGPKKENTSFVLRLSDSRQSKLNSASPSTESCGSVTSSTNQRFVPLTAVQPSVMDDASVCASINSGYHSPQGDILPLPVLLLPPQPRSSSSSSSPSQHLPAAVTTATTTTAAGVLKPANSKSPPMSANTKHAGRPLRPTGQQLVSPAKVSGTSVSSPGGAAVTGPRRVPAMSACAIVGVLTSVTPPEAASASK